MFIMFTPEGLSISQEERYLRGRAVQLGLQYNDQTRCEDAIREIARVLVAEGLDMVEIIPDFSEIVEGQQGESIGNLILKYRHWQKIQQITGFTFDLERPGFCLKDILEAPLLPNKEDGVPFLTQMPIEPGKTHVYRFPIIQSGTHWYHSHSGLQEQIGMYGSFIMNKRKDDQTFRPGIDDLPEVPLILSEWTNYDPENINRMLHNANDWAAIKKNAVQSYGEAIMAGHFTTKLTNEWKRMLAMDVSDVYYDKILINGSHQSEIKSVNGKSLKAGDKVRLRISNGGAAWARGGKRIAQASSGAGTPSGACPSVQPWPE